MERPKRLTAAFVKTVKAEDKPRRYGDGPDGFGLFLIVKRRKDGGTSKSFAQRIYIGSKPTNLGLGRWPIVSLKEARVKALENRRLIAQGKDPRGDKRMPTFAEAVEKVIALHSKTWRGGRQARDWRATLTRYAYPRLGRKRVDKITTADVLAVLTADDFWNEKRSTASRVRNRISKTMQWCVAQGYREANPAGDAIGAALPRNGNRTRHHKAIHHTEVAAAIAKARAENRRAPSFPLLFGFVAHTAARGGEARAATWDEMDLDARLWTVPASRMKGGREHVVPLSDAALAILAEAAENRRAGSELVFPSATGKIISATQLGTFVRELNLGGTLHGLRSSFRDWCTETGVRREAAERALAHTVPGVEGAYDRTVLLDERREVMERWGAHATP